MFDSIEEIQEFPNREELVKYLEGWGIACYDSESTSTLRQAAVDTFQIEGC